MLNNPLFDYAVEAGEIDRPLILTGEHLGDPEQEFDDVVELVGNNNDEVNRACALAESLESMYVRFEKAEFTVESMESYTFTLSQLIKVSGLDIPVSVAVPSFEEAEKDKKSIGDKIKGTIDAILKWIRERLAALGKLLNRFLSAVGLRAKKADEDTKAAAASAAKYKTEGFTTIGHEKFVAPADKKFEKQKLMPKIPTWMVQNNGLEYSKITSVLGILTSKEVMDYADGEKAYGGKQDTSNLKQFLNDNGYKKAAQRVWQKIPQGGTKTMEYKVDVPQLTKAITEAYRTILLISNKAKSLEEHRGIIEKNLERAVKKANDKEAVAQLKEDAKLELQNLSEATHFLGRIMALAVVVHKDLTRILA
jgi:hypothetical protein